MAIFRVQSLSLAYVTFSLLVSADSLCLCALHDTSEAESLETYDMSVVQPLPLLFGPCNVFSIGPTTLQTPNSNQAIYPPNTV